MSVTICSHSSRLFWKWNSDICDLWLCYDRTLASAAMICRMTNSALFRLRVCLLLVFDPLYCYSGATIYANSTVIIQSGWRNWLNRLHSGWLALADWLAGWLAAGPLAGWLTGWLEAGWLADTATDQSKNAFNDPEMPLIGTLCHQQINGTS